MRRARAGRHTRGGTRFETAARNRRDRAQAHLERVRHGARPPVVARPPGPLRKFGVLAASVAIGALFGPPIVGLAAGRARLDTIHVRGAVHLTPDQVAEASGIPRSATLSEIDAGAIADALASHPWIARARAAWLPGAGLVLDVTERNPVGVVTVGTERRSTLVDESGTPFAPATPQAAAALPQLTPAEPAVANRPNPSLAAAAALAARLPRFGLDAPSEVRVARGDEGFSLRLAHLPARFVLGRDDFDAKLEALARLLSTQLDEVRAAAEVDLRFADQAVLRGQAPRSGAATAAKTRGRAASSETRPSG